MKDFLPRLGRKFACMMDIENTTVGKDGVEDMEDLLHGSGVVFVATVQLSEGVNDNEGRLEIGHNLNQIRDIVRVIHHVQTASQMGRIKDDEVTTISLRAEGW